MNILKVFASLLSVSVAKPEQERFTHLPGAPADMPSASYSGFVNVTTTKALHYIFLESQSEPSTDPLLVWFNGGPGCSSMIGFM